MIKMNIQALIMDLELLHCTQDKHQSFEFLFHVSSSFLSASSDKFYNLVPGPLSYLSLANATLFPSVYISLKMHSSWHSTSSLGNC